MGQMLFMPGYADPGGALIANTQISSKVGGRLISNKPRRITADGKLEEVVEYVPVPKQQPIGNVSKAWDQAFQVNSERELDGSGIREYVQDRGSEASGLTFQDIQKELSSGELRSGTLRLNLINPNLHTPGLGETLDRVNSPPIYRGDSPSNNQKPIGSVSAGWDQAFAAPQPSQVASQASNAGQRPAQQPVANGGQQPLGSMSNKWDQAFGQK